MQFFNKDAKDKLYSDEQGRGPWMWGQKTVSVRLTTPSCQSPSPLPPRRLLLQPLDGIGSKNRK